MQGEPKEKEDLTVLLPVDDKAKSYLLNVYRVREDDQQTKIWEKRFNADDEEIFPENPLFWQNKMSVVLPGTLLDRSGEYLLEWIMAPRNTKSRENICREKVLVQNADPL